MISMRQKGIGASWTEKGIQIALANLSMLYLNGWSENWFKHRIIDFKLTPSDHHQINVLC